MNTSNELIRKSRTRNTDGTFGPTHRMSNSAEYRTWRHMISRCHNENVHNFRNYGGRGIRVCHEWRESFESFLGHVGKRPSKKHSIERINNNVGYQPGNVCWKTNIEQSQNRRTTKILSANGESKTIRQWADSVNLPYTTLKLRLKRGWALAESLEIPHRSVGKKHRSSYGK